MNKKVYIKFISDIKKLILQSRYQAAKTVNKELLLLYFKVGQNLSQKLNAEKWGAKVLDNISEDIQQQFPGLRGFSKTNLKNMNMFYETYSFLPINQPTILQDKKSKKHLIGQSLTDQFNPYLSKDAEVLINKKKHIITPVFLRNFLTVSFTHHILLLNKIDNWTELEFYINETVKNQWSVNVLEYQIASKLFKRKGKALNNFKNTLPVKIQEHALQIFKDEYLLDFINIPDENINDERVLEQELVKNIRHFILSLGKEFAFMGNQYRLIVDGEELFIDLLFYHRGLQSLIAIELKAGKFKPEYLSKMNTYLAILNDKVKLPNENPSIGIILCKEKNKSIVEYALQDNPKPVAVGTYKYKYFETLPAKWQKYLPKPEQLKKLLN